MYVGNPEVANFEEGEQLNIRGDESLPPSLSLSLSLSYLSVPFPDFKHVRFAETSCTYGTIELTLHYRPSITLPDK